MPALSQSRTRVIARLQRRKSREREGLVLVEGPRAVGEVWAALQGPAPRRDAGRAPWFVASPRLHDLAPDLAARLTQPTGDALDVTWVDDAELAVLSATEAHQGVLMVVAEPRVELSDVVRVGARLLVLDGIQDPGNLGTLVRTAAAFALDGVIALDGTVDPWNPKAVRSAAGSSFRMPLIASTWAVVAEALAASAVPIWVADAGGHDVEDLRATALASGWALVLGSEGQGARPEVVEVAAGTVAVPMPGGTESLNVAVAGALLTYALTRRPTAP